MFQVQKSMATPPGFFERNICDHCEVGNCSACFETQGTFCTDCKANFWLENNACAECATEGCSDCKRPGDCTACETGFELYVPDEGKEKGIGQCRACPSTTTGCLTCENSVCTSCITGYFLSDGKCLTCISEIPGCVSCTNSTYCNTCNFNGGYLQPEAEKVGRFYERGCTCKTDQGFIRKTERVLKNGNRITLDPAPCECPDGQHNIELVSANEYLKNITNTTAKDYNETLVEA